MRYPLNTLVAVLAIAQLVLSPGYWSSIYGENPQFRTVLDAAQSLDPPLSSDVAQLIEQLGASEFSVRRQAFLGLWSLGELAMPAIATVESDSQNALRNDSERSRAEAVRILKTLLELKIAPQQLEQSPKLLELMGRPAPAGVVELCDMGYWTIAQRMLLENSDLSQQFHDPYGRYLLSRLVDSALEQKDATLAWPIVRQLAMPPQAAWIAHKTGLELIGDDPYRTAQALYLSGDVDAALEIDLPTVARIPMLTRSGRWQRLLDESVVASLAGRQESASQRAVIAVLHEVAGDYAQSAQVWEQLLQPESPAQSGVPGPASNDAADDDAADDAAADNGAAGDEVTNDEVTNDGATRVASTQGAGTENGGTSEVAEREAGQIERAVELLRETQRDGLGGQTSRYQLMAALLFSGRVAAIEQMYSEQDPAEAFNFFLAGNQHLRALETLGLAADMSNFDEWLELRRGEIVLELGQRNPASRQFDQSVRLCSTLSDLGLRQQSQRLLDELVELASLVQGRQTELWSRSILTWLGRSEVRQMALTAAKGEFPKMSAECQAAVLKGLFPEFGDAAFALWSTAPSGNDQSKWKAIESLYVFDRGHFGRDYRTTLAGWLQRASDVLTKETLAADHLLALAKIALGFGESDMAIQLLMSDLSPGLGQSMSPNLQWATVGRILTQRGTPESALPLFEAVRQTGVNPQSVYIDEVDAHLLSGHFGRARALDQARWLRPLATTRFFQGYNYLQAATDLFEENRLEHAVEYAEAAFLLSDLGSMDVYWGASKYAEILEKMDDPVRRADVLRAAWVESMQPYASSMQYMISNGYAGSLRFAAQREKLARAIVCIDQGDMEGYQYQAMVAAKLQAQDIEMVCKCYPLLLKAGKPELAEELYSKYQVAMLAQLERWPDDSTALNNLAWMYAQCDRQLDDAARLSQRAVELAPSSAVFLDTLGEVQFRQGDLDEALETMRQCIRLDPRERHYRENLVRYQSSAAR